MKGIHAIIEILLCIVLLILHESVISRAIVILVNAGLAGHPESFIAEYITQFGLDLSLAIKLFFAFYFGSHGIVNLSLVYGIIKKPFLAYPISLLVFIGFLIYQTYSYLVHPSGWLLGILIIDVLFIILLCYEYHHHLKKYSFLGKLRLIVKAQVPKIVEIKIPVIKIVKWTTLGNKKWHFPKS